ncbi:MAG: DNA cytosine methyltransferase [Magnetococcales bacterium]|nr:DNA cytosine methyltransferase [Magnetococcales bacterium]
MKAYYNENDPKKAAWLRELIRRGLIAHGEVDERDIRDVRPSDLDGYGQHHFFAGVGGWPYALELAGWPADRPVWTGSCPCQPFSQAGKRAGFGDERHLWPAWQWLIEQCQPETIFGEQVARLGGAWFDLVCDDLEGMGYAIRATVLPACSVGAPHIRERLFWVADGARRQSWRARQRLSGDRSGQLSPGGYGTIDRIDDAIGKRLEIGSEPPFHGRFVRDEGATVGATSAVCGWEDVEWIPCRDGKKRPTQPGLLPLADGVPARVVRIGGYGNAIMPQVAAEVIKAVMSIP